MERNGKQLKDLGDGHPRRLSDGRNAWRKMSPAQRQEFLLWIEDEGLPVESCDPDQTDPVYPEFFCRPHPNG